MKTLNKFYLLSKNILTGEKYYNYKGRNLLTLDFKNELFEYYDINIFACVRASKSC